MAKKLIFALLVWLVASPAFAVSYTVWQPEPIEETPQAVSEALPGGSTSSSVYGYTTGSMVYSEFDIMPMASYDTYDDGILNSHFDWAKGFIPYVAFDEDYVFARTGQYTYMFAIGDFSSGFSGSDVDVYELNTGQYNQLYSYGHYTDSSFSLSVGNGLVYSSVPGYPTLTGVDRSTDLLIVSALVISCVILFWLASHAFIMFGRKEND